jgi:hypothetical protein
MTTPPAAAERSHGRRRAAVARWVRGRPWAASFVLLVAFALAVRLVWGWHVSTRLDAALDALRARGEPASLNEIVLEPLDDADNAWVAYMKAHAGLNPTAYSPRDAIEYPPYPPYGAEWEALAEASERKNAAMFPLARAARRLPRAQLRADAPAVVPTRMVRYSEVRRLAYTLADGAAYAHLKGRDGEAVERLMDVLHVSRSLRQDPFVIAQLLAVSHDVVAADTIQQIAPRLVIVPEDTSGDGPATRRQVKALIAALLDEAEARKSLVRSMSSERAMMLYGIEQEARGTWAIRPLAHQAALRNLPGLDALVEAAGQPTFAAARQTMEHEERRELEDPGAFQYSSATSSGTAVRYSRWFDEFRPSTFLRVLENFFQASAERRATAVVLAARLYHHDHGRWPDDLASLVPAYLDALPANPFLDGDRPLGYVIQRGALPGGGDRPLVYFDPAEQVGDHVDPEPMYGWQSDRTPTAVRGRSIRQYRDLALWMPATRRFDEARRLAAEAVEDDAEEADEPGDGEGGDGEAEEPAEQ